MEFKKKINDMATDYSVQKKIENTKQIKN